MTPNLAITPAQPQASQALLRERLSQLEAVLLEARGRVMFSFDRELASVRGWMDSLESFDPTVGLHAVSDSIPEAVTESLQELLAEPPLPTVCNIVPFMATEVSGQDAVIEEPPVDPCLARATLDELNAALTAAFQQVAEK